MLLDVGSGRADARVRNCAARDLHTRGGALPGLTCRGVLISRKRSSAGLLGLCLMVDAVRISTSRDPGSVSRNEHAECAISIGMTSAGSAAWSVRGHHTSSRRFRTGLLTLESAHLNSTQQLCRRESRGALMPPSRAPRTQFPSWLMRRCQISAWASRAPSDRD